MRMILVSNPRRVIFQRSPPSTVLMRHIPLAYFYSHQNDDTEQNR